MLLALLLASELIDGRGTHFDLGREAVAPCAALGRHEFGWMLSIKPAGKDEPVVLLDSDPSGWNASLAARPHLGLLYGVRPPADAKQRFIDSGGSQTPAPVVPWTMEVL